MCRCWTSRNCWLCWGINSEHNLKSLLHSIGASWRHFANILIGWGPFGLLFLAVLDSAGVPVVGGVDALLIAVATNKPEQAYWAAALAVIGSLAGSLVLFFVARKGGEVLLMRHVTSKTGARMHLWFQRWGLATVFVPALSPIPLPMKIPVFCAGALQVHLLYFVIVVVTARTVRYFGLAYLGIHFGTQTLQYMKTHGWEVALGALGLAALLTAALRLFQKHEVKVGKPE
jgi:membrane protein YqaA with SNARE-associated domain